MSGIATESFEQDYVVGGNRTGDCETFPVGRERKVADRAIGESGERIGPGPIDRLNDEIHGAGVGHHDAAAIGCPSDTPELERWKRDGRWIRAIGEMTNDGGRETPTEVAGWGQIRQHPPVS